MKEYNSLSPDEIDFKQLFIQLWSRKKLILLTTLVFSIISIIVALITPNEYQAKTLLAPTNSETSLTSKLGAYSSLASLSGINLPTESASKSDEAVERIQSFEFFSKHFLPFVELEDIFAVKSWNAKDNKIKYDSSLFDDEKKVWVRDVTFPKQATPSEQEAYEKFKNKVNVNVNKTNSFVTLSVKHKSPYVAKDWLDIIIYNINESMRLEDIELSKSYIDFLNESQNSTNVQSLREVASQLLESQMQTLMLASSNEAYIFKIIDSPVVPEEKFSPNRPLIVIIGTIFGIIFSIFFVFLQDLRRTF